MILYHKALDTLIEVPDNESTIEVLRKSGWEPAADPEETSPAVVAEQPKRARKTDQPSAE